jgi:hypothetical protein
LLIGAALGAACGTALAYALFTESGRHIRERMEPAIDDLRREFARFQKTFEKVGDLANDGLRVFEEIRTARGRYPTDLRSH